MLPFPVIINVTLRSRDRSPIPVSAPPVYRSVLVSSPSVIPSSLSIIPTAVDRRFRPCRKGPLFQPLTPVAPITALPALSTACHPIRSEGSTFPVSNLVASSPLRPAFPTLSASSQTVCLTAQPFEAKTSVNPLEYALTKIVPVTPLECALTKNKNLKSFRILTYKKNPGGEGSNC